MKVLIFLTLLNIFCLTSFIIYEWFDHGGNWDGVFLAIEKHQRHAKGQDIREQCLHMLDI